MIPFTYLVKHVPTNRYYYGVKIKKGCHPYDLWTKYFTSSKKVKGLIKRYGKKSFIFEIRKTFKTQKAALNWEHKVLRRMKVIHRDDFLNQSDNLHVDPKVISKSKMGKKNPMYGKKMSEEHKKKIKDSLVKRYKKLPHHTLGRKHTPAFLKFLSKINKGKNNRMYGVKMSKESRKKMSIAKYKYHERMKKIA
jgi:hypothetical protein